MITQFPLLNFHHSSLITHHSFFHTHLATSLLFSSLNFFTLFMGPTPVSRYIFFFFSTQLTEANIYIKKKKKNEQPTQEKKKKKKMNSQRQPKKKKMNSQRQPRKKKSKGGQKLLLWVPYVCLITILSLSYELWKLKITKSCFQFP